MEQARAKELWRTVYRPAFEELERMRLTELAAMTEEEACRRMALLEACPTPWRERPDWSGLVEQQAYFHRRSKA
jgi:hypothetical protein